MNKLDEFDIRESFDAMDDEKLGEISIGAFHTMCLGLGYSKASLGDLKDLILNVQGHESFVTIETALTILSKQARDREAELSKMFALVDTERKGFISVEDIERLAQQVGTRLTRQEAEAVWNQSSTNRAISTSVFRDLFSPVD